MPNKEIDADLIAHVQLSPELWDTRDDKYKDNVGQENIWGSIAKELNTSG